jgi:hypothetical protein
MEKFFELTTEIYHSNLLTDVEDFGDFAQPAKDSNFHQKTFLAKTVSEEVVHIKPNKPWFKAGTILRRSSGQDDCREEGMCVAKRCRDEEDEDVSIFIGNIKHIENIGDTYRVEATIMVVDETIEIRKYTKTILNRSTNRKAENTHTDYSVTHYVHALDGKQKILIPTALFKERFSDGSWNSHNPDLKFENNLDMEQIMRLYAYANPEEVIHPFKVAKEAT